MITLVGVGHVFDIGNQVREVILHRSPTAVCLELDRERFFALMNRGSRGGGPFAYRLLALFQRWIATRYGVEVGEEMIAAAQAAREVGAQLAFIDMSSTQVFARFWSQMSFKERMKMVVAIVASMFVPKRRVEKELEKYEMDNVGYLESFAEEFPVIKRVLIDERDLYMAEQLKRVGQEHENVVAIVGDGHIEGLSRLLSGEEIEIIRLRELRSQPGGNAEVTFSFSLKQG